jgi:hypothetical protein
MAFNSILNFFRIEDDEGYEDDDGMYADEEETKQERPVSRKSFQAVKNDETDEIKNECLRRVKALTDKVTMYKDLSYED